MPKHKNQYGQYMTPLLICDFMVELISHHKTSAVLEPSCGDGAFIESLNKHGFFNITAYEIDKEIINGKYNVKCESFVSVQENNLYDVIIGNPPYIRWKNLENNLKDELKNSDLWNQYCNCLCDYSNIFILKAIELLKDEGELIFITPEYWISSTHAFKLRNFMLEHGYFENIYYFNETPIFKGVTISLVIFKYVKSKHKNHAIKCVKYLAKKRLSSDELNKIKNNDPLVVEVFSLPQFKTNENFMLIDNKQRQFITNYEQKCRLNSCEYAKLGDYCDIGNGMVSGLDKAFQIQKDIRLNTYEQQAMIKVIKAKALQEYYYTVSTPYIFIDKKISENDLIKFYPNYYAMLVKYKDQLVNRYNYGRDINYWEWVFLRNYTLFNQDCAKIFVPCKERVSNKNNFRFTFVESGFFPTQDVIAIYKKAHTKEHLLYILALLNSSYVFNWLKVKGVKKGDIVEFSVRPVAAIPYRSINFNDQNEVYIHDSIVEHVQMFLTTKQQEHLTYIESLLKQLF